MYVYFVINQVLSVARKGQISHGWKEGRKRGRNRGRQSIPRLSPSLDYTYSIQMTL